MTNLQVKNALIILSGAAVLLVIIFVGRDVYLRSTQTIQCEDGPRMKIDIRDFSTKYWAYAFELEANMGNKARFATKLNPKQVHELSEASQQAGELRKYLVAGYNACAINKAQFEKYARSFQVLDSLSRQINSFLSLPTMSTTDKSTLSRLLREYTDLVHTLAVEKPKQ